MQGLRGEKRLVFVPGLPDSNEPQRDQQARATGVSRCTRWAGRPSLPSVTRKDRGGGESSSSSSGPNDVSDHFDVWAAALNGARRLRRRL
jgi:hypothetical protein